MLLSLSLHFPEQALRGPRDTGQAPGLVGIGREKALLTMLDKCGDPDRRLKVMGGKKVIGI